MKIIHEHRHRARQQTTASEEPKYEVEERQIWAYNSSSLKLESCGGTDSLCQTQVREKERGKQVEIWGYFPRSCASKEQPYSGRLQRA